MPIMLTEDGGVQLTELFALDTESVHLVRRPAIGRRFLLTKSENKEAGPMLTLEKDIAEVVAKFDGSKDEAERVALRKTATQLFKDLGAAVTAKKVADDVAQGLVEKGQALFKGEEATISKSDVEAWLGEVGAVLKTAKEEKPAPTTPAEDPAQAVIKAALANLEKLGDKVPQSVVDVLKAEAAKFDPVVEVPEDVRKSLAALPANLRDSLTGLLADRARAVQKAAADREAALLARIEKAEKSQQTLAEQLEAIHVEKHIGELTSQLGFKHVSGDARELAQIIAAVEKSDPKKAAKLIEVLKSADEAVAKSGIFNERGITGAVEGSTEAKVEAIAKSMMAADKALTIEAARAKAWKDHPELLRERRENR